MHRVSLLVLLASLAPLSAQAVDFTLAGQPGRFDVTESLDLIWHGDPGNGDASSTNYGEGLSRLNLQLTWGQWLLGMRVDSSDYVNVPQVCQATATMACPYGEITPSQVANRFEQHPIDPEKGFEKLFLTFSSRYVDVTAGDSYVTFGRGLVLALRKVDELGVDTTLTGGKVIVHAGDFGLTAVGGITNTQNLVQQTSTYWLDPNDPIFGARGEYRIARKVIVGVQGAGGWPSDALAAPSVSGHDHYFRYGASVDVPRPLPWLSLYGEYAHAQDILVGAISAGNAYYGTATVFAGRTTWVGEFKSYTNFNPWTTNSARSQEGLVVYNEPPTLERIQTQLLNDSNITAGRLRTDVTINPRVSLYFSPEYGQLHPTPGQTDTLVDLYAGAELRWNDGRSHAFPLVGWRMERTIEAPAGIPLGLEERLVALEGSLVQSLGGPDNRVAKALRGPLSMELDWLVWFREIPLEASNPITNAPIPWIEGQVYLSVKATPRYQLILGYEFTNEQNQIENQHNFLNGAVQWNITPSTAIRLFGGGQRAGLKCINGQCAFFPAFQGARFELVVRG